MNSRRTGALITALRQPVTPNVGSFIMLLTVFAFSAYLIGKMLTPQQGWTARLLGQSVHYSLVRPNTVINGNFRHVKGTDPCLIQIALNTEIMQTVGSAPYLAYITAHELGHCFDIRRLDGSHGDLNAKQSYLEMYKNENTARAETYADAYAMRYLTTCNTRLEPLGWPVSDGECPLPDPRSITEVDARLDPWKEIYNQNSHDLTTPAFPSALIDFRSLHD